MVVATRRMTAPPRPLPPPPDLEAHPSEEELIASFLRPRAEAPGGVVEAPRAFIHDADVYSADPAELTAEFAPAVAGSGGDGAWYFFSAVRAKTRDGQRKARTVDSGEGCWHSEAGAKPVVDDAGRYLGNRQSFSFVTKVDGRRVRSGWLMVELSLDDVGGAATDMVLCKIYFSPRARANGVSPAASSSSSLAGRKRKPAAAATGNNKINPASAARQQQRRRRTRSNTDAGAQPHDEGDTGDDEGEESTTTTSTTQGGQVAAGSSAAGDPDYDPDLWTDRSLYWDRIMKEYYIVDRSDEELRETLGLTEWLKVLTSFKYGDDMDPKFRMA